MTYLYISIVSLIINFSKADFYSVIAGDNENSITNYIKKLESAASHDQKAYKGALLMKKASFQKTPKEKLAFFKEGKLLLEKEINANVKNTEYRFLRLIIQENAPKILKYNTNISEDAKWVAKYYELENQDVKNAVLSYAKNSETLKL